MARKNIFQFTDIERGNHSNQQMTTFYHSRGEVNEFEQTETTPFYNKC